MTGNWETHRGDEWWYSDPSLETSAGVNQFPRALVIGALRTRNSAINCSKLHSFLWRTSLQFPDSEIWLLLNATTRPLLLALAEHGSIQWQPITNPLSQEARITSVAKPIGAA